MKILTKDKIYGIMAAALAVFLLGLLTHAVEFISSAHSQPKAKAGLLDLSGWDLQEDGVVQLAGEWEFYWDQLLAEDDFVSDERQIAFSGYQKVPSVWNQYDIGQERPDGMGFATYRLRVRVADGNEALGLSIRTMSTSYRIFINGKEVASAGTVGTGTSTALPEYKAQVVAIVPASDEFEIIIQVSNFTYARGGIWRGISLGTEQQVRFQAERAGRMEAFSLSALLIMACYHIFLYLIQKRKKEMIYISVAMLVTAVRVLVTGQYYITKLVPGIPFSLIIFIEYMTIFWNSFFLLLFSSKVYPEEFSRRIIRTFKYICVLFTVIILISPLYVYTNAVTIFQLLQALILSYNFAGILIAVKRKRHDAFILFISVILIICNFIVNRLSLSFIILDEGGALTCTMVAALLLQAYILAKRYNRAFDDSREYSRELGRLSSIKDELIANTAHELRTPLNGIISMTESILQDGNQNLVPHVNERLGTALIMERSLSHMIDDVSDFVGMNGNKLYLEKNTFEITPLIDNMIAEVVSDALRKGVSVIKDYHDGDSTVTADKYRIAQIIFNLLDRAVKSSPNNGQVTVHTYKDGKYICIAVSDGSADSVHGQFARLVGSLDPDEPHAIEEYEKPGPGLNLSQAIARAHGGDIQTLANGKYILTLPLFNEYNVNFRGGEETASAGSREKDKKQLVMKGTAEGTIVVLDDQYTSLAGLSAMLNAEGYTVKGFTDAAEGLEDIFSCRDADIVIADLIMPRMPGYEICRKIRLQFSLSELPVLVLSARKQGNSTIMSLEAGANDVLHKPFDREELLARISTLRHMKASTEQAIQNEVAMLQAQINPHFLHNALNALAASCYEDQKAYDAIVMLSDYFRYSFSLSPVTKVIPLNQEIELMKAYLSVEKLRFGHMLDYDIRFEDTDGVTIRPFMIQPLVENAVRHGVTKREGGGHVKVFGCREKDLYKIVVEDDGAGMEKYMIDMIMTDEKTEEFGIGLRNVRQRLIKWYHSDLHIESAKDRGTRISYQIDIRGFQR